MASYYWQKFSAKNRLNQFGEDVVSTKSPPLYFLGFETCFNCRETVFAAEDADLEADCIRYRWTCDLCGYHFTTEAELIKAA